MSSLSKFLADPSRVVMLSPLVLLLHVTEEAPGFVAWFNSLVRPEITQSLFITVNVAALVLTLIVTGLLTATREKGAALLALAWFSLLMFANAVFHLTGTIVHSRYSPGSVTAAILYLPYFSWFLYRTVKSFNIGIMATLAAIALGSAPMLIHGYLIVFRGSRLF